ncbi:Small nuclear ribonucleoprotein Sm D2 [Tupaia chinensis]|uniref:Small nuclear ribonucleoprotein Sm D2 n=1 Tax=Tupaia chinensis TaxID=246437 RepID=L9KG65_TUPCH|nr:Small nuclear ribonucleoprotein Sm D2 [Tupaia chinensis]
MLTQSAKNNTQELINCFYDKKILGCVETFDRHYTMVLENVKRMRTEFPKNGKDKKKSKPVNKDRYISKMFLHRNVGIVVLQNPLNPGKWNFLPAIKTYSPVLPRPLLCDGNNNILCFSEGKPQKKNDKFAVVLQCYFSQKYSVA